MNDPMFRLEGVVRSKNELEDFEGPLQLILQLLSKNKIEIRDIRISLLLEQYLGYLDNMRAMDLEIASEFVAMASHLVYIKTKTLLEADTQVEELTELIDSLEALRCREIFGRIKENTAVFSAMLRRGSGYISKPPEPVRSVGEYRYFHEAQDIYNAIRRVLDAGDGDLPQPDFVMPRRVPYPISDKTEDILRRLRQASGPLRLRDIFSQCRDRSELIAAFVSVLELCHDGSVCLSGEGQDMIISALGGEQSA